MLPRRTFRIRITLPVALLVGVLCCAVNVWAQGASPRPYSKEGIIGLLKGEVSPKRIAVLARQRGIDFQITPKVESELRRAGATAELLATLREVAPKTSAPQKETLRRVVPARAARTVRENPKDGLKYVWIPPGTFMMGCSPGDTECDDGEKPAHRVAITRGFWMGQTPVTVGAYRSYAYAMGRSMPPETDLLGWGGQASGKEAMPIVDVTWDDAQAYCACMGGRLPTEAEWEYAARGGATEARYGSLDDVAWYVDNSGLQRLDSSQISNMDAKDGGQRLRDNGNGMHEVGSKRPNAFGLYDMLGNVWEWVNDWYDQDYYKNSPSQDPMGPASRQMRVQRGGAWLTASWSVRVSTRTGGNPANGDGISGFRCVGEVFATSSNPAAPQIETPRRIVSAPAAVVVRENPKDGLKYVWIPPGTFMMGCSPGDTECDDGEKPAHQVTITRGFWIGQTPVPVPAYKRFTAATGQPLPLWEKIPSTHKNLPAVGMTWDEARAYCEWAGGRLPTEAEWEYVARGGSTKARDGPLDEVAWHQQLQSDVGEGLPNGFGLFDILRNVAEWVNDRFQYYYYRDSPSQDPPGPSNGDGHVFRGGPWIYDPSTARVSYRAGVPNPDWSDAHVGFRCGGEVFAD